MYSVEIYQRIRRACHVDGLSIRERAAVGVHRKTVKKMLGFSIRRLSANPAGETAQARGFTGLSTHPRR